ncbi:hypothetical protein CHS0354_003738, partial [Potamilus streckersoni]
MESIYIKVNRLMIGVKRQITSKISDDAVGREDAVRRKKVDGLRWSGQDSKLSPTNKFKAFSVLGNCCDFLKKLISI